MNLNQNSVFDIINKLKTVVIEQPFPPVGDPHGVSTYSIYGEKAKKAYFGEEIQKNDFSNTTISGKDAQTYYKDILRSNGKTSGLAIMYGGGGYTIHTKTGVTVEEGEAIRSNYFRDNPKIERFVNNKKNQAKQYKFVTNLFKKRRYIPNITSSDYKIKAYNERIAMNAPIQSSGADQLKLMMIKIDRYCEENKLNKISGNLLTTYNNWYTRIVCIVGVDNLDEISKHLDVIEDGNCKVVVFDNEEDKLNEKISHVYDRNLRLTMSDINKLNMSVLW